MEIFPRGIAHGRAFYDRIEERKKLKKNIDHNIHTALIAPRRFGKTSLITQVLHENKIDNIWIDFMTITGKDELQYKLLQKISEIIIRVSPPKKKLKSVVVKYFASLKPEIIFSLPDVSLKLHPEKFSNENIIDALISLDKFAQDIDKHLVIVFDEFQEIIRIDEKSTLQGSIRHAVERAKNVTYLFSGSKHRPLRRMFNGKSNPLYALCDIFELSKIARNEYVHYVNAEATKRWGLPLSDKVIDKILTYSDRYPKYINALCSTLWASNQSPTPKLVEKLWSAYIFSRKTDIAEDLSELTLNQRRLLQYLCFKPTKELYGKEVLVELKLSQSSVQKSVKFLLEKDYITNRDGIYRVLDPIWLNYYKIFG